jgi:hypothetical protein
VRLLRGSIPQWKGQVFGQKCSKARLNITPQPTSGHALTPFVKWEDRMRTSFLLGIIGLLGAFPALAEDVPFIEGHYDCTEMCDCSPVVRSDNTITQKDSDNTIHVTNVCNKQNPGRHVSGRQFWVDGVPSGSGTTLTISRDGKELSWGHGSIWRRK